MRFIFFTILTLTVLAGLSLEAQLGWVVVGLAIGALAFFFYNLRSVKKINRDSVRPIIIDCATSFFITLAVAPFALEQAEFRGYVKEITVPTIVFVVAVMMFIGYQIRPLFLVWLRSKGLQTEILETKDEKKNSRKEKDDNV